MTTEVPFIDLQTQYQNLKSELDPVIQRIFEDGTFILGEPVRQFEENISNYLNVSSVGCASGSDALLLAFMAEGIGPGDEVITTPFTFFATAGAIMRTGATPVFVDIDSKTYNIDPNLISSAITEKTKAILPVHLFGQPADMTPIMELAEYHQLIVIEDACQAIGAEYKGQKVGSIGDYGCFSFFPTKNLGAAGDGGLISTKHPEKYELLKKLRVHGASKKYHHDLLGLNSRLDSLQAAILDVKLQYLDSWNTRRREIAKIYSENLPEDIITPFEAKDSSHVYHQYAIQVEQRDMFLEHLKINTIAAGVYYPVPLHLQSCFSDLGYRQGDLAVCEKISDLILSLPIYPEISQYLLKYVISTIQNR